MRFFNYKDDLPERELTWEELHPRGARKYLGIFFRNIGKILKLNFLFLIFCLPVFTIPASFAAMNKISSLFIMEEGVFLFSDFFRTFKQEFVSSLKLTGIGIMGCLPAVLVVVLFQGGIKDSTFITIVFGITIIVAIYFLSYILIALKMLPLIDIEFKAISKNSFILTFTNILINYALIIIILVVGVLIYIFSPVSLVLIVLPFPSIINFFVTLLYFRIFKKSRIIKVEV